MSELEQLVTGTLPSDTRPPKLGLEIPLEGSVDAWVDSKSLEESCRLGDDLAARRDVILAAIEQQLDQVIELLTGDCEQLSGGDLFGRRP